MTAYIIKGYRKVSTTRLLIFHLAFCIFSNCVNPITPEIFLKLGMPDYMFGVAFAAMAGASFATSPFFGSMCRRFGSTGVFAFGMVLHAVSQGLFSIAVTQWEVIAWRLLSGVACSASTVSSMCYLMDAAGEQKRYGCMLYHSAISTVGCAAGYSIGGIIGTFSIPLVFSIQILTLLVFAGAMCVTLRDPEIERGMIGEEEKTGAVGGGWKAETREVRAAGGGIKGRSPVLISSLLFLTAVFLSSFATTAYDNAYNYYIKEALDLPNYYNGLIRAGIGVIALIVDFTVGIWMIRKTDSKRTIIPVLLLCAATAWMVPAIEELKYYIIGNFIFYGFNSLYTPMQQALVAGEGRPEDSSAISGLFTSFLFGGKVLGALFAGFLYTRGNQLPFFAAAVFFLLAAAFSAANVWQRRICVRRKCA